MGFEKHPVWCILVCREANEWRQFWLDGLHGPVGKFIKLEDFVKSPETTQFKFKLGLLGVVVASIVLVACGGGGGGSPSTDFATVGTTNTTTGATTGTTTGTTAANATGTTTGTTTGSTTGTTTTTTGLPRNSAGYIYYTQTSVPALVYGTSAIDQGRQAAFTWANNARQKCGLGLLAQNTTLDKAAQNHANYLGLNQVLGHTETPGLSWFTGATLADRIQAVNTTGSTIYAGEIAGMSFTAVDEMRALASVPFHDKATVVL
jgi:uncharacterized protein YkwD